MFIYLLASGKTSLIHRYKTNLFTYHTTVTMGVEMAPCKFAHCQLNVWDTGELNHYDPSVAGQERYEAITTQYLRNGDCVILVYDLTDPISFKRVQHYASLFEQQQVELLVIVIILGKS